MALLLVLSLKHLLKLEFVLEFSFASKDFTHHAIHFTGFLVLKIKLLMSYNFQKLYDNEAIVNTLISLELIRREPAGLSFSPWEII